MKIESIIKYIESRIETAKLLIQANKILNIDDELIDGYMNAYEEILCFIKSNSSGRDVDPKKLPNLLYVKPKPMEEEQKIKFFDVKCCGCKNEDECVSAWKCLHPESEIPSAKQLEETLEKRKAKELEEAREKIKTGIIYRTQSLRGHSEVISIKNTFKIPNQDFEDIVIDLIRKQGYQVRFLWDQAFIYWK
jgi:hypothetical protein